jgi:hypothetical protein
VKERKEWREDTLINTNQDSKGPYNLRRSNASVLVCLVVPPVQLVFVWRRQDCSSLHDHH